MHVAIVLDGNRRFAKKLGMEAWKGHEFGAKKVEELLDWCKELGVKELTLYSFSVDNFKRPEIEKKALFGLFKSNIKKMENDERIDKNGIRLRFIGRIEMFPSDIQEDMKRIMEKTKDNSKFKLNFAMAYSGKMEITDSMKKIIKEIQNNNLKIGDLNEKLIEDNLYLSSKPDIFIRPGGEKRMSDFLIWQSAYSELFFLDKLWPEMEKEDLAKIIEEFKQRERRFGK
jgi:tritrans,polycis-undecaprenyl-diphosphate synthase [geranylgeranyl-diphosphate specific]